jgi:site-specific recombinase XerD
MNTGAKIRFADWNPKRQHPVPNYSRAIPLMNHLNAFATRVEAAYAELVKSGIEPTAEQLRQIGAGEETIQAEVKTVIPPSEFFYDTFQTFVRTQGEVQQPRTIQKYQTLLVSLKAFEAANKTAPSFESIDLRFYEAYRSFLLRKAGRGKQEAGLLNDTISKYIATLKTFMQWAMERQYHSNEAFKKFKADRKPKNEIVTLTESELLALYRLDLSKSPRLERVRDVFCFGCFTGQRWSDIEAFKAEDVKGDVWDFESIKTKKRIKIPFVGFTSPAKDILLKYGCQLPRISSQNFNDYIKEVGKLADIASEVIIKRYSGSRGIDIRKPKYEFMSSHMARRSFVTILLQKGIPATTVQKFTGHSDIRTLMKYENTGYDAAFAALERIGDISL